MDNLPDENVVYVATTENRQGRADRGTVRIMLGLMGVLFFCCGVAIALKPPCPGEDPLAKYLFVAICVLFGPIVLILLEVQTPRGIWYFDSHGIRQVSHRGKKEVLNWNDIDSVIFQRPGLCMRSGARIIKPVIHTTTTDHQFEIWQLIESHLKDDFDLRSMPHVKTTVRRWLWLGVTSFAWAAFILGPVAYYAIFLQVKFDRMGIPRAVGTLFLFVPIAISLLYIFYHAPKPPRWRKRHERYAIFDEPKT